MAGDVPDVWIALYLFLLCSNLMIQKRRFFESSFGTQKWFSSSFNDDCMDFLFQRVKWHNDQTIPYFLFVFQVLSFNNNFKCIYAFAAIHTLLIRDSLIFVLFFSFQIDWYLFYCFNLSLRVNLFNKNSSAFS
jgi:hypothetical protein